MKVGNNRFSLIGAGSATLVIAIVLLAVLNPVNACIDPASLYAFEVVLNKPGVSYNLTPLEGLAAEGKVLKVGESTYIFTLTMVSGFGAPQEPNASTANEDLHFLVVVYVEKFFEGAPYVEGLSSDVDVEYYLGLRLESITTARSIPEEILGAVVEVVLNYLVEIGVITGLEHGDVLSIAESARLGYAGWNNRLVYCEQIGGWAPYSELVNSGLLKGVLYRGNACAIQIPGEILEGITQLPPLLLSGVTSTIPTDSTPVQPGVTTTTNQARPMPFENGLIVALSLVAGIIAGIAVYIYLTRRA